MRSRHICPIENRCPPHVRAKRDIDNVSVDVSSGMFYEYAASINAVAVVKGVRNTDDYLYELWQAEYNRSKNPDCELVLLPAYGEMTGISSTLARSLLASGKDISGIVSDKAAVYIGRLMKRKKAAATKALREQIQSYEALSL